MAGTLTISTLSDGTNSTSSTNCIQGSAKAWVQFTGSTATINGSYNASSITRSAAGAYTVNFTNALSNANYAICLGCSRDAFDSAHGIYSYIYTAQTTSSVGLRFYIYDLQTDPTTFSVSILR